ncbi:glycosyltransferase family 87 protein [Noviherbaspirillum pedocola]|uniref:DUF2029 domain-containing protein n=1 Tax=Noviherbaspirillum pedocola TaxID=2801341 RepID=A0A934W084_9BURK|nr:glycosyltransferase family 87 protein [Noviherbaspirillum pedocola]MBK4733826.1 DUF2029 domain-containing protein [Noviherbaspirillum pedocola]
MTYLLPALTRKKLLFIASAFSFLLIIPVILSFDIQNNDKLKVFGTYWEAGRAALTGENPFEVYPLTWFTGYVTDVNLNPPTMLPLFQFFAQFDPTIGAKSWATFSILLFLATCLVLFLEKGNGSQRRQIVWVFLAPAFTDTVKLGQIYIVLFALAAGAWLLLRSRHQLASGICIGFIGALKPNFALWAIFLLLAGYWRPAVAAGITGLAILGASILLYGIESYQQWIAAFSTDTHAVKLAVEVSIHGYFSRLGFGTLGTSLSIALLACTGYWVWRRRPSVLDASRIGLMVAILASPLAWFHYLLFLIPALIEKPWTRGMTIAAVTLMVPPIVPMAMMYGPFWLQVLGSSVYFGAVCTIFVMWLTEIKASMAQRVKSEGTSVFA